VDALARNTSGFSNTATGVDAMFANTTGIRNTAVGVGALLGNIPPGQTGNDNTAVGFFAMVSNKTGDGHTAIGDGAMYLNGSGSYNTAIGLNALTDNFGGSNNIALGASAGENTRGDNNIDIGHLGAFESNIIRIGTQGTQTATFIAGISGASVTGTAVVVNGSGQLGVAPSSQRFKAEIKPMGNASGGILALKPVIFHYKSDAKGIPQFGLIAEDVEKVNPDLVVRDKNGEIYSVRYDAVNAMLLNEFLKEHKKVQELGATVAKQEAVIAKQQKDFQATAIHQQKQIEVLTAGLQRVSAQLEVIRPAPQTALNNP
jgi:hypothetical protein